MVGEFISFIHILCGVTFLGVLVASFFYIANSIRSKSSALIHYAIRASFFGDAIIFPMVVAQFVTGTLMVTQHQLSFQTPWIIVAYHFFGLVSICWFLLVLIKYKNIKRDCDRYFKYQKIFYTLNILVLILFVLIIHDAVTQSTWFFL